MWLLLPCITLFKGKISLSLVWYHYLKSCGHYFCFLYTIDPGAIFTSIYPVQCVLYLVWHSSAKACQLCKQHVCVLIWPFSPCVDGGRRCKNDVIALLYWITWEVFHFIQTHLAVNYIPNTNRLFYIIS